MKNFWGRLSTRLILATMAFLLLLVLAVLLASNLGLRTTQRDASERSAEALVAQGRAALQQLTGREAQLNNNQLQQAALLTKIAARYMEMKSQGNTAQPSSESGKPRVITRSSQLTLMPNGLLYDSNPDRRSETVFEYHGTPEEITNGQLRASAVLDPLFPNLLQGSRDIVAIYYLSPQLLMRYYPVIGLADFFLAENQPVGKWPLVQGDFSVAPINNPNRDTVWDPPYVDNYGQGMMITVYSPVYFGDEYQGFVAVDVSLSRLIDHLQNLRPAPVLPSAGGYAFLVNQEGRLVAAPPEALDDLFGEDIQPETDSLIRNLGRSLVKESKNQDLQAVVSEMQMGKTGVAELEMNSVPVLLAYAPMPDLKWSLGLVAPVDELTAQANAVAGEIKSDVDRTQRNTVWIIAAFALLALTGVLFASRFLTRPIGALAAGAQSVAAGNLEVTLPVPSTVELGSLAQNFNLMTGEIKKRNAELAAANLMLEHRVQERTKELSTLLGISHTLASTLELKPLLDLVLEQLKEVVDFTGALLLMFEEENELVFSNTWPEQVGKEEAAQRIDLRQQAGLMEACVKREPVILAQPPVDTVGRQKAASWLVAPLLVPERVLGFLILEHTQENFYTPAHAQLVAAFAVQAAVTIENAHLYGQAQHLAALQERQRLARELHDSVSQALYGIALGARTARKMLDRGDLQESEQGNALQEPLDYVLTLADAGLAEMRALIFELRPESLANEGLVAALTKQAAAVQARYGLHVKAELCDEPDVSLAVKEALYRISQEALNNVVKHARARNVSMVLTRQDGLLHLGIADDGVGFDPKRDYPGHLGLRSMPERIERLGGKFKLTSVPGTGTQIEVEVVMSNG
jgi:signal transduction histidine kinase